MMYPREVIEELNALSQQVFRSKSKWRKMVEKGVAELIEEDTIKLSHDGTTENVKTPKLHYGPNGGESQQYALKRYTVEEAKDFMLKVLDARQKIMQELIKQQKEKEAADQVKKTVSEQASGSSI